MYFATYNGPSHSHWDLDRVERFDSIADAKESLRRRTSGLRGTDDTYEYRRNEDGLYVPWSMAYVDFLGTESDYIDLYAAIKSNDGQWEMGEDIIYRLTLGERGGVVVEKG